MTLKDIELKANEYLCPILFTLGNNLSLFFESIGPVCDTLGGLSKIYAKRESICTYYPDVYNEVLMKDGYFEDEKIAMLESRKRKIVGPGGTTTGSGRNIELLRPPALTLNNI